MKKLALSLLIIITSCTVENSSKETHELLYGWWEMTQKIEDRSWQLFDEDTASTKVTEEDLDTYFFGKKNEFQVIQNFGEVRQYRSGYDLPSDTIVKIGEVNYKILKISSDSMTLEFKDRNGLGSLGDPERLIFIKSDKEFKLIKEYDTYTTFYPNGQKEIEGSLHNGFFDGKMIGWYENGNLQFERHFKEEVPHGVWTEYHNNGEMKEKQKYDLARPIGIWSEWDENGVLVSQTNHDRE